MKGVDAPFFEDIMKPIRFIRAWQTYRKGAIITPTAAFGQTLVLNKFAEYVVERVTEKRKTLKLGKRAKAN